MAGRNNWGNDGATWDERNWDAVQKQEQKKQDVLVMASQVCVMPKRKQCTVVFANRPALNLALSA